MDNRIKIGDKLCIVMKSRTSGKERMSVSQLLEDCGGGEYIISTPISKGRLIPIRPGTEIKLIYYRKNGIFSFGAKVTERKGGRLPTMKVQALSAPQRTQRRDYYRLEAVLSVKVYYRPEPESSELAVMECVTLDISAGGLKLASDVNIEEDEHIICEINILDKVLSINGKVIRNLAVYNQEYEYELGVQFVGLNEKTRLELISFIFEEERKLKRKGLI